MAAGWKNTLLLILTLAIFALCQAQNPLFSDLAEPDTCNTNCSDLYKATEHVDECERGCRFHIIAQFVAGDQNSSVILNTCYGSCIESYNETAPSTEACKNGCDFRETYMKEKQEKEAEDGPSIHLLSPLMQVRTVYTSVVGAFQIIRSSIITYFISDDNSVVAVESEPEIIVGINADSISGEDADSISGDHPLFDAQNEPRQLADDSGNSGDPSVVACVSNQLGVPPYILVASAVALVVFTLYVIIAFCSTTKPPKSKAYVSEMTLPIDPMTLPVKLVRPEDLTKLSLTEDDDMQAPPLPTKVKLPDSLI